MIKCLISLFVVLLIFNIVFFDKLTQTQQLRSVCKIYYRHGAARYVEINNHEYDLQKITIEDHMFMNPWTQELIDNTNVSDCLQIKE
jgi:hypothetical protein